jgi:hypothetical protein
MARIKGKEIVLTVGGTSIAYATNHTLDLSTSTTQISDKDISSLAQASITTSTSWTMSSENFYSIDGEGNLFDILFAAWQNGTLVDLEFGQASGVPLSAPRPDGTDVPVGGWTAGSPKYSGNALVTQLTLNAPDGDLASFSCTFSGVGKLISS